MGTEPSSLSTCYGYIAVIDKSGIEGPLDSAFEINSDEVTIGRIKGNDIRIKINIVSRIHAKVLVDQNGACTLLNLSKTNPTLLNDVPIVGEASVVLQDQDVFTVGERKFKFRAPMTAKVPAACMFNYRPTLEAITEVSVEYSIDCSRVFSPLQEQNKSKLNMSPMPMTSVTEIDAKPSSTSSKSIQIKKVKTPLRDAINARRKSYGKLVDQAKEGEDEDRKSTQIKKVKTPLRDAINARRKSYGKLVDQAKEGEDEEETDQVGTKEEEEDASSPSIPIAMNPSILDAINKRRLSYSSIPKPPVVTIQPESASKNSTPCTSKIPKSAKKSSKKRIPNSKKVATPCNTVAIRFMNTPEVEISQNIEDDDIDESVEEVEMNIDQHKQMVISTACAQISVQAMAHELQLQGVSAAESYNDAKESFLASPRRFSDAFCIFDEIVSPVRPNSLKKTRGRKSLLNSVEKKGQSKRVSLACDVVESLTDEEMYTIDDYALKLEDCGVDGNEAYGIALNAYLIGIEKGNEMRIQESDYHENDNDLDLFCAIKDGKKLDFIESDKQNGDLLLVEAYSKIIIMDASVDPAIAYGCSLDCYLSNPQQFRDRITKMLETKHFDTTPLKEEFENENELLVPTDYFIKSKPNTPLQNSSSSSKKVIKYVPLTSKSGAKRKEVAMDFVTQAITNVVAELAAEECDEEDEEDEGHTYTSPVSVLNFASTPKTSKSASKRKEIALSFVTQAVENIVSELILEGEKEEENPKEEITPKSNPNKIRTPASIRQMKMKTPTTTTSKSVKKRKEVALNFVTKAMKGVIDSFTLNEEKNGTTSSIKQQPLTPVSSAKKLKKIISPKTAKKSKSAVKRREVALSFVTQAILNVVSGLSIEDEMDQFVEENSNESNKSVSSTEESPAKYRSPIKCSKSSSKRNKAAIGLTSPTKHSPQPKKAKNIFTPIIKALGDDDISMSNTVAQIKTALEEKNIAIPSAIKKKCDLLELLGSDVAKEQSSQSGKSSSRKVRSVKK